VFGGVADYWMLVEGEDDDFFAADGADVVVETDDASVGDGSNEGFELRAGRFQELGADLLEEVAALFRRHGFDELSFGGGEDVGEANDDQVVNEVSMNVLRPAAHVFLLELGDA